MPVRTRPSAAEEAALLEDQAAFHRGAKPSPASRRPGATFRAPTKTRAPPGSAPGRAEAHRGPADREGPRPVRQCTSLALRRARAPRAGRSPPAEWARRRRPPGRPSRGSQASASTSPPRPHALTRWTTCSGRAPGVHPIDAARRQRRRPAAGPSGPAPRAGTGLRGPRSAAQRLVVGRHGHPVHDPAREGSRRSHRQVHTSGNVVGAEHGRHRRVLEGVPDEVRHPRQRVGRRALAEGSAQPPGIAKPVAARRAQALLDEAHARQPLARVEDDGISGVRVLVLRRAPGHVRVVDVDANRGAAHVLRPRASAARGDGVSSACAGSLGHTSCGTSHSSKARSIARAGPVRRRPSTTIAASTSATSSVHRVPIAKPARVSNSRAAPHSPKATPTTEASHGRRRRQVPARPGDRHLRPDAAEHRDREHERQRVLRRVAEEAQRRHREEPLRDARGACRARAASAPGANPTSHRARRRPTASAASATGTVPRKSENRKR